MKHWSELVPKRTQTTKRLAKISNSLSFEIEQKSIELKSLKKIFEENEQKIILKLADQYNTEIALKRAIETAITTASQWNNSPVLELVNSNIKNN